MIRVCERPGCGVRFRETRRFCGPKCANADRQRRYRERQADTVMIEIEIYLHEAFGVSTSPAVAAAFRDDFERWKQMGYSGGHRNRTPITPV